jgi:hypothetical protein
LNPFFFAVLAGVLRAFSNSLGSERQERKERRSVLIAARGKLGRGEGSSRGGGRTGEGRQAAEAGGSMAPERRASQEGRRPAPREE